MDETAQADYDETKPLKPSDPDAISAIQISQTSSNGSLKFTHNDVISNEGSNNNEIDGFDYDNTILGMILVACGTFCITCVGAIVSYYDTSVTHSMFGRYMIQSIIAWSCWFFFRNNVIM